MTKMCITTFSFGFHLFSILWCSSQTQIMRRDEQLLILKKVVDDIGEISGVLEGLVEKVAHIESSLNSTQEDTISRIETIVPAIKELMDAAKPEAEAKLSEISVGISDLANKTTSIEALMNSCQEETSLTLQTSWTNDYLPHIEALINASREDTEGRLSTVLTEIQGLMIKSTSFETFMNSSQEETTSKLETIWTRKYLPQMVNLLEASRQENDLQMSTLTIQIKGMLGHFKCTLNNNLVFGSFCYILNKDKMSWLDARQHCQAMRGDLVKITSNEMLNIFRDKVSDHYWVGLNDIEKEGTYTWSVDKEVHNPNDFLMWWNDGEPNDHDGEEDCIHFRGDLTLNDIECSREFKSICQVEISKLSL